MDKYVDRKDAGVILANYLVEYTNKPNVLILALPRGGVPVAFEIAKALSLPLDVFIVRKLGHPDNEEFAMGAIASGGVTFFNEGLIQQTELDLNRMQPVIERETKELLRREVLYRGNRPYPNLRDKTVILVDDGIATGSTMRAAIQALRTQKTGDIVIATPVAALSTCKELAPLVDKIICPLQPLQFYAVGLWYESFPQTSDEEVIALLKTYNVP